MEILQSNGLRILCAAIAGVALAGAALADEAHRSFFDTEADTGPYADLALGPTDTEFNAGALINGGAVDVRGRSAGFQLGGGYRPMPAWSGELDYVGLGRASSGSSYIRADGWELSGLLYLPTPYINLYGRLGLLDASTYGRCVCSAGSTRLYVIHHSGFDPVYGVGLITNRRGNFNLKLEFEKFGLTDARQASLASIGVIWTFL